VWVPHTSLFRGAGGLNQQVFREGSGVIRAPGYTGGLLVASQIPALPQHAIKAGVSFFSSFFVYFLPEIYSDGSSIHADSAA
jgi:hypothetical protein